MPGIVISYVNHPADNVSFYVIELANLSSFNDYSMRNIKRMLKIFYFIIKGVNLIFFGENESIFAVQWNDKANP